MSRTSPYPIHYAPAPPFNLTSLQLLLLFCFVFTSHQPTDGAIGDRLSLCDRSWYQPLKTYSCSDDSAVALADVQNNLSAYLNKKDACDDSSLLGRVRIGRSVCRVISCLISCSYLNVLNVFDIFCTSIRIGMTKITHQF